jgi:hypothetical protein
VNEHVGVQEVAPARQRPEETSDKPASGAAGAAGARFTGELVVDDHRRDPSHSGVVGVDLAPRPLRPGHQGEDPRRLDSFRNADERFRDRVDEHGVRRSGRRARRTRVHGAQEIPADRLRLAVDLPDPKDPDERWRAARAGDTLGRRLFFPYAV